MRINCSALPLLLFMFKVLLSQWYNTAKLQTCSNRRLSLTLIAKNFVSEKKKKEEELN